MAGLGSTAGGKCAVPKRNQFLCAAGLAESRWFAGFSRSNEGRYRGRNNNHRPPGGATIRAVSHYFHDGFFRAGAEMGQSFFTSIFKHALDRSGQVPQTFLAGCSLPMSVRHFRTGGDQELLAPLNDGGKLMLHPLYSTRNLYAGQPGCCVESVVRNIKRRAASRALGH